MLIYAELEDAVIERLTAARDSGQLGYRPQHIDSYGGEFDSDTFFESFKRFPAVWVTVGGEQGRQVGARDRQCTIKLAVMVGARSPRGERFARRGLAGAVGTYQLLQDVRDLLGGRTLGLGISPLRVGATRTLYNTRIGADGLSVLAQELEADYTWTAPHPGADESAAPDLATIALHYRLQPGDAVDDAVDIVIRPGAPGPALQLVGEISVSEITSTGYVLLWPAATGPVAGYELSLDAGATWVDIGPLRARAISGRAPGAVDQVRVRAYGAAGQLSSELVTAVKLLAPPVQILNVPRFRLQRSASGAALFRPHR